MTLTFQCAFRPLYLGTKGGVKPICAFAFVHRNLSAEHQDTSGWMWDGIPTPARKSEDIKTKTCHGAGLKLFTAYLLDIPY